MTEGRPVEPYRGNVDRIINKVEVSRGLDLSCYRRSYVERRVSARMRTLECHTYRQYADLLDRNELEYEALLNALTINVTEFFRDGPVWEIIRRKILRDLVLAKTVGRSRNIRIWSAGCATGQEVYSIAMALLDVLGEEASRFVISVTGSDLDPVALAHAEKAVYDVSELSGIPSADRIRFVERVGDSSFTFTRDVRRMTRFSRLSLFDDSPMKVVDLILCRNVLIYFNRDQQARVLDNFWSSLSRGGYLILGRSEKLSPEMAERLQVVDGRERMYRKRVRP